MVTESCFYSGRLKHHRFEPLEHGFQYRLFLAWIDLGEWSSGALDTVLRRGKFSAASLLREDHLDPIQPDWEAAVRKTVASKAGREPRGPIRVLTPLRHWGYYFSPLTLYYCYQPDGRTIESVLAEVGNTPWGERHWYVLHDGNRLPSDGRLRFRHAKAFHVSPFMPMDLYYEWTLQPPGLHLAIKILNRCGDRLVFAAQLTMRRLPLTQGVLRRLLVQHPWMSAAIIRGIYVQAAKLWWKGAPFVPHPGPDSRSSEVTD